MVIFLFPYHLANNLFFIIEHLLEHYVVIIIHTIILYYYRFLLCMIIVSNRVNRRSFSPRFSTGPRIYIPCFHFVNCTLFCVCYLIIVIVTPFVNLLFKILIKYMRHIYVYTVYKYMYMCVFLYSAYIIHM